MISAPKSFFATTSVSKEQEKSHVTETSFDSNRSSPNPQATESLIVLPENRDSVAGLLSRILQEISSLKDQQAANNNEVNKKLDALTQRQDIIEKKVNTLANSFGIDFDGTP